MRRAFLIVMLMAAAFVAGYCQSENSRPRCTVTQAAKDMLFKK